MSTEPRPKVKYNRFDFYVDQGFRLLLLDNRTEIDGEPNQAYRKRPVAANWQKRKGLNAATAHQRMKEGFNIGAAIPETVLIVDVDTRNGGLKSLPKIVLDCFKDEVWDIFEDDREGKEGLDPELSFLSTEQALSLLCKKTYAVKTSDNGHHFYFRRPAGMELVTKLANGIDVLSHGRQVVTPGSLHPKTNEIYEAVGIGSIADPPTSLLSMVTLQSTAFDDDAICNLKHDIESRSRDSLWGCVWDVWDIERLLCPLQPEDFRDYNAAWFPLLCACHHASGGSEEAKEVFINWSSWDTEHVNRARPAVEEKWASIGKTRRGETAKLATVRTLLAWSSKACNKLIVAGNPQSTRLRDRSDCGCLFKGGDLLFAKDVKISDVLGALKRVRESIVAQELVEIKEEDGCSKILQWIDSLKPGWEKSKPGLKNQMIDVAACLDESLWPEVAAALSKASTYSVSAGKIEKQIKEHKKASLKEVEQEDYDLTQSELVEAAAGLAMRAMVGSDGLDDSYAQNIICPPNRRVYKYINGKWSEEQLSVIEGICYNKVLEIADLKKKSTKPATDFADKAVSTILKRASSSSMDVYARKELPNCINLLNGTIWFSKGNRPEYKEHRREDYLTTQLPFKYDPQATCPDFETMLEQVFAHAGDERPELIRHFCELMGYMIQPNKDIPKILIWTGEGQNGKSRIAKTISKLVGDAWLRTDIHQFFSENQPHNLHAAENKLVIMDDDLRSGDKLNDGALKKVSETTSLLVNPKNKDAYTIRLQLIPLIISNSTPKINDISNGMIRRLDVIDWGTNLAHLQDSLLPDKVDREQLPGVLNLAIEGLARLRSRGHFDPPACSLRYRDRFLEKSNTIYGFWVSHIKSNFNRMSNCAIDLYNSYKSYVYEHCEGRPVSRVVFRENMRRCGVVIEDDKIKSWGCEGEETRVRQLLADPNEDY